MIRAAAVALIGLAVAGPLGAAQVALNDMEIQPHVGATLPLDLAFRDEMGHRLNLGTLLDRRPAILALVYFRCPNLCGVELTNLAAALDMAGIVPGRHVEIIAISMDAREASDDAAARKAALLRNNSNGAGWHFLVGEVEAITALAERAGFPFRYDAASDQYIHATGIAIATPGGVISGYLAGLDYAPDPLRHDVAEAAAGKTSGTAARVWLACFGASANGRPAAFVRALLPGTAALGLIALGGTVLLARRRGRED